MGKAKDLIEAEKCIIVKELAKGTPPKVIAISIGRHVDTVKRYLSNPSPRKTRQMIASVLKKVTDCDRRNIKRQLFKNPGENIQNNFPTSKSSQSFEINAMLVIQGCSKEPYVSKTTSLNTQGIAVKMG